MYVCIYIYIYIYTCVYTLFKHNNDHNNNNLIIIYTCIYIYIYIYIAGGKAGGSSFPNCAGSTTAAQFARPRATNSPSALGLYFCQARRARPAHCAYAFLWWHYSSNATCLIRLHLFYVFSLKDHHHLLQYSPLLKKPVLDK